jgi:hypothetical protein
VQDAQRAAARLHQARGRRRGRRRRRRRRRQRQRRRDAVGGCGGVADGGRAGQRLQRLQVAGEGSQLGQQFGNVAAPAELLGEEAVRLRRSNKNQSTSKPRRLAVGSWVEGMWGDRSGGQDQRWVAVGAGVGQTQARQFTPTMHVQHLVGVTVRHPITFSCMRCSHAPIPLPSSHMPRPYCSPSAAPPARPPAAPAGRGRAVGKNLRTWGRRPDGVFEQPQRRRRCSAAYRIPRPMHVFRRDSPHLPLPPVVPPPPSALSRVCLQRPRPLSFPTVS